MTWYNNTTTPAYLQNANNIAYPHSRHFEGGNILYADGHVKWQRHSHIMTPPATPTDWRLWWPSAP